MYQHLAMAGHRPASFCIYFCSLRACNLDHSGMFARHHGSPNTPLLEKTVTQSPTPGECRDCLQLYLYKLPFCSGQLCWHLATWRKGREVGAAGMAFSQLSFLSARKARKEGRKGRRGWLISGHSRFQKIFPRIIIIIIIKLGWPVSRPECHTRKS